MKVLMFGCAFLGSILAFYLLRMPLTFIRFIVAVIVAIIVTAMVGGSHE